MLGNIKEHSIMVARVAEVIASGLLKAGLPISLELTIAASLLHDIAKTVCIATGEDHSRKGMEICRHHALPRIAEIVGEHVILKNGLSPQGVTEKEIVYYSDKRVNHDRIVPLDNRLAYILERYGQKDARRHHAIMRNFEVCRQLEEMLFLRLTFQPSQLEEAILSFQALSRLAS